MPCREKAEILGKRTMGESDRSVFAELERNPLLFPMVRLIQEELHHFEQVLEIMAAWGIPYGPVTASRYARSLLTHVRTYEPAAVVDKMIIGAYIEARSCERFIVAGPFIWTRSLACFYVSPAAPGGASLSGLPGLPAQTFADEDISERAFFGRLEAELICSPDRDSGSIADCLSDPTVVEVTGPPTIPLFLLRATQSLF